MQYTPLRSSGALVWFLVWSTCVFLFVACSDSSNSSSGSPTATSSTTPQTSSGSTTPTTTEQPVSYLSPTDHLVRVSITLRGVRPSVEELEQVREQPETLPDLVDVYLESEEFGRTIREMHNELLQLRPFFFWFPPRDSLRDLTITELNSSAMESPLRLIEHVVRNDRPYSEIVTADYTLADSITAQVWGMEYDGDGETWIETRWPDERPHAGVLSESLFYLRHYSTPDNGNRSRANAVTKNFLCFDFLDNDVNVDGNIDLSDPDVVRNAVKSPECASCHQALDPIASLFWKHNFFVSPSQQIETYPFSFYAPQWEGIKHIYIDRDPAYFGTPISDIRDLGLSIAKDPRFATCAAKRFAAWFTHHNLSDIPVDVLADYHTSFVDSDLNAKALARAIVLSDFFRVSHANDDATAARTHGLLKVRPRQLSTIVLDATGFDWAITFPFPLDFLDPNAAFGRFNLLHDSLLGYEVLAGGIDDFVVTRPVHTINPTISLVYENLAFEAAGFIVERDFASDAPIPKRLLTIPPNSRDETEVRNQLVSLHTKLLAEFHSPDSPEINDSYSLFSDALAISDDPSRAWKTVLSALLQDVRFLYY